MSVSVGVRPLDTYIVVVPRKRSLRTPSNLFLSACFAGTSWPFPQISFEDNVSQVHGLRFRVEGFGFTL